MSTAGQEMLERRIRMWRFVQRPFGAVFFWIEQIIARYDIELELERSAHQNVKMIRALNVRP